jgi:tRNA pseudouridine38-40 synthase
LEKNLSKIVLVLEYDGSNYRGFQYQENAGTIQAEIEKALFKLTGESPRVVGASRTDSGVHAKGQVVSFRTTSKLNPRNYVGGLNFYLPQDIAVNEAYKVNNGFSVQHQAVSREYRYLILNRPTRSPLQRNYAYHVGLGLNSTAMDRAAQELVGEHDLASFVTEIKQSNVKSTVKRVLQTRVGRNGQEVTFDITANSFLPHQVRNTIGTLIQVGLGKLSLDEFVKIMEAKKPGLGGPTVPAQGLTLIQVNYPRPLGEYHENL